MDDDTDLLRRYAEEGDEVAFTELVRSKVNLVHSAALRQVGGDAQLAQDVTQVVFIDLARKARSLARHTALTGWLYTSTRFAATKAVRAQARWQNRKKGAQEMHEFQFNAGTEPDWAQLRIVLDDAMCDLGDRDRQAVLLRYFEDRPLTAVGERIGLSENSARMRVERALEKLRRALERRGIRSGASALALVISRQAVNAAPAGLADDIAGIALAGVSGIAGGVGVATVLKISLMKGILIGLLLVGGSAAIIFQFRSRQAGSGPTVVAPAVPAAGNAAAGGGAPRAGGNFGGGPQAGGRGGGGGGARGGGVRGAAVDFQSVLQSAKQ